jgi:hypothetical protein
LSLTVAPVPRPTAIRGVPRHGQRHARSDPIRPPPDVSADDGGVAATAAEENVAAVADAVADMAEHLTIGTDNANAATGPVDLGAEGDVYSCIDCRTNLGLTADIITKVC